MFGSFKLKATVFGGVGAALLVFTLFDANDLETNYTVVEASITEVKVDCFIKKRRRKIIDKRTNEMAYMDCKIAPLVAARHDYSEHNIHKRATFKYRYRSPADKGMHDGSFERTGKLMLDSLKPGTSIRIYAHNTNPEESRKHSNPFVEDKGV